MRHLCFVFDAGCGAVVARETFSAFRFALETLLVGEGSNWTLFLALRLDLAEEASWTDLSLSPVIRYSVAVEASLTRLAGALGEEILIFFSRTLNRLRGSG